MKNFLKKIIKAWKAFIETDKNVWNPHRVRKVKLEVPSAFFDDMKTEAAEIARGARMQMNEHMDEYLIRIVKKHLGEQLFNMYQIDRRPMPFLKVKIEPFTSYEPCVFGQTMKIWIRETLIGEAKFTAHINGGIVKMDVEEKIT